MQLARAEIIESVRVAAAALNRYKLRTALSVLGVVLGVGAVIAMMSVSEGANREALAQVEALGLDSLVARSHASSAYATGWKGLIAQDAERVLTLVPLVEAVSPVVRRDVRVAHAGTAVTTRVLGIRPTYQQILRLALERGRFLTATDERAAARACILGGRIARRLFGFRGALGERVAVGRDYCEVVGVLRQNSAESGAPAVSAWHDVDSTVFLSIAALTGRTLEISRDQPIDELWLHLRDGSRAEELGRVLQHTLESVRPDRAFIVVVPRAILAQRYRMQRTFNVVVGSVAALALLVGGIGIMNIMLTSVVERTREIGIRRMVGATRRDVTLQFLTETLLMTLTGGAAGIVGGIVVSWAITAYAGWSTHLSALSIGLGFGMSIVVGLIFGLYPAMKAAALEPVDAMRYE